MTHIKIDINGEMQRIADALVATRSSDEFSRMAAELQHVDSPSLRCVADVFRTKSANLGLLALDLNPHLPDAETIAKHALTFTDLVRYRYPCLSGESRHPAEINEDLGSAGLKFDSADSMERLVGANLVERCGQGRFCAKFKIG